MHVSRTRDGPIVVDDAKRVVRLVNLTGELMIDDIAESAGTVADLFPSANWDPAVERRNHRPGF